VMDVYDDTKRTNPDSAERLAQDFRPEPVQKERARTSHEEPDAPGRRLRTVAVHHHLAADVSPEVRLVADHPHLHPLPWAQCRLVLHCLLSSLHLPQAHAASAQGEKVVVGRIPEVVEDRHLSLEAGEIETQIRLETSDRYTRDKYNRFSLRAQLQHLASSRLAHDDRLQVLPGARDPLEVPLQDALAPRSDLPGPGAVFFQFQTGPDRLAARRRRGAGLLLFSGFLLEHLGHERAGRLLRAVVVTAGLLAAGHFWRLPRVRAPFAWGVWHSVWAVILGTWAAALTHRYHVAALHLIFIGGLSLMILMVGARVVLSHGGYMALEPANRPIRWVGTGVTVALLLRLAVDTTAEHYFQVAAAAAAVWMAACILWLVYHLPKMIYRHFAVVQPARSFRVVPPKG